MTAPAPLPVIERRECEPPLGRNIWPAFGKPRVPGDILFWPRSDQRVLGIPVHFTHWAVYVGRRKLSPCGTRWMVDTCEVTGETLPEAVVHLWGAPDAADRDMSSNAVVVHNRLDEVGGTPYDGNLCYDKQHTPRRPEQILHRVLYALGHKLYEDRFGKYDVVGNNCEHFCTWVRRDAVEATTTRSETRADPVPRRAISLAADLNPLARYPLPLDRRDTV